MGKQFAIVIMDGMVIYVSSKTQLMISQTNAKMVSITMVTVTVKQIIMGHGVKSILICHRVFAIQVSPELTVIRLYALIDALANYVELSIIMHTATLIFKRRVTKKNYQKLKE